MKTDVYDIQDTQATSSARIATALTALLVVLGLFFISFFREITVLPLFCVNQLTKKVKYNLNTIKAALKA